jgi:hypothetical protein
LPEQRVAKTDAIETIFHFAEYHATMGGIYKGKDQCHSLCVRSVTNLEEPTATDEWKVPSSVAESSVSIKDMASLT